MKKAVLFCLFLNFGLYHFCFAQLQGKPFVRNYPSKVYKGAVQNWAIVQDFRGLLYFANDQGVLEYDGKNWQLIPTSNNSPVRSLAVSSQGTVYVGGSGEIGYLNPDAKGQLKYYSLKDKLPKDAPEFEDVYTTHASPEGIYFHNDKFIFLYNPLTDKSQIWYANPDSFFFLTFYVQDKLYVLDLNIGLMALQKGKIQLIKGGEKFKDERIYTILPYSAQKILIGTRKKGLFIYNPNAIDEQDLISEFETPAKDFLLKNQLYNGNMLPNGDFALCTREGGLVILDKLGNIREILDEEDGLNDHNVRAVYTSHEGVLWLALDNGISQVNLNIPIRFWDASTGLKGVIRAITEYNKKLYVATSLGVYYLENKEFKKINGIATECWAFLNFTPQDKNAQERLLVGSNDGIYEILGEQVYLVKSTRPLQSLSLTASLHHPNYVFVGLKGGFMVMDWKDGAWQQKNTTEPIKDEIYSITEDDQGYIWLATFIKGVLRLELNEKFNPVKITRLTTEAGLPSERGIRTYYWQKRVFFATPKGLYRFDNQLNRFVPDSFFGTRFSNGSQGVYRLVADAHQNIWLSDVNTQKHPIGIATRGNKSYDWNDTILRRLPEFSEPFIYPARDGLVWLGGSEDLFVYDINLPKPKLPNFSAMIRRVRLNEDSVIFYGTNYEKKSQENAKVPYLISNNQVQEQRPIFEFNPRFSIDFECSAPYFDNEFGNEYSFALVESFIDKPSKNDWSAWTKDSRKQYTNLQEGNYTFYVKVRNTYGEEGQISRYQFRIRPPWYRTVLAYIIYAVLGVALLFFLVYVNSQRLLAQQAKLQRLVEERTHEISEKNIDLEQKSREILIQATKLQVANEEILKKNAEIEEKNEDITDSINYASRVQNSMLPSMDKMKRIFPDSFIIYKPRDIVGGDFYWLAETPLEPRFNKDPNVKNGTVSIFKGFSDGKKIIAACDCTGHGIPAALVSMIGDSYLNQIINFEGVKQAHLILKELDFYLRHTLNQDETDSMDGMDMALCVIDPNSATLEYAGAKNPLVYIQDGEIQVIRGDKYGIGGYQMDTNEKFFTRHIISIDKPTSFYIFSDGFEDQFGGPRGKKFMIKQMRELFLAHHEKPMEEQKVILEKTFMDWMEGYDQVDDVLMIGIHLNPALDFYRFHWV